MLHTRSRPDTLAAGTVEVLRAAGDVLLGRYDIGNRVESAAALSAALGANEDASRAVLVPGLRDVYDAAWLPEADEQRTPPAGDWWAVDAVEGNVNHVHGLPEWAVTATLVSAGEPILAVVHQPVGDVTTIARAGGGASRNGAPLEVSAKCDLAVAVVATGQAEAGQTDTYAPLAASVDLMLERALLVRTAVPSTFPLLQVAAGHADAFWQFSPTLPGVAAGVLAVREAGGVVTDLDGRRWTPGRRTVLAAAPGVHAAMVDALGGRR